MLAHAAPLHSSRVALHRDIEGPQATGAKPVERLAGRHERRPERVTWQLATGTLACPECDAPVLPGPAPMAPPDPIACGFCRHAGVVRDFLSLAEPTRPARVTVVVRGLALR
jgi:hypothetical protein